MVGVMWPVTSGAPPRARGWPRASTTGKRHTSNCQRDHGSAWGFRVVAGASTRARSRAPHQGYCTAITPALRTCRISIYEPPSIYGPPLACVVPLLECGGAWWPGGGWRENDAYTRIIQCAETRLARESCQQLIRATVFAYSHALTSCSCSCRTTALMHHRRRRRFHSWGARRAVPRGAT